MSSNYQELEQLSQSLLFISESEYPLEPFALPAGTSGQEASSFLKAIGQPEQTVEEVTVAHFFRNMVRPSEEDAIQNQNAQKFMALQQWLEKNLKDVKVYRLGQTQVQAYVVGQAEDQTWMGVKTTLIET
ncbi:nuclease [Nibribacter ruber]|uniref:Nuclease n=1 Tax=Nibribacter ruber TaxID=2698458 RepID=A0A6P1P1Z1_9BACT|nr:nuclease A inhibitor family protein [Nibribacter ruber]QHL88132.1 nuclease [Nibribacter ruber]